MELRQLRYFIGVADAKSYSLAAKNLFVTQPTLTWTVKKLESELGTPLLTYGDRTLQLTESGELLYEEGKHIIRSLDDLLETIQSRQNPRTSLLKVGLTVLFSIQFMPAITRFLARNASIEVSLVQTGSKRVQEMVAEGELDVGIVSHPIFYSDLEVEPLLSAEGHYDVSVVVHADNALAARSSVNILDLKGRALCSFTKKYILGNVLYDRCREKGFEPNIAFKNDNWEVLLEHIATSDTIGLIPTAFSQISPRRDLKWIPLDDKINRFDIGVVKRRSHALSKEQDAFLQALKEHV